MEVKFIELSPDLNHKQPMKDEVINSREESGLDYLVTKPPKKNLIKEELENLNSISMNKSILPIAKDHQINTYFDDNSEKRDKEFQRIRGRKATFKSIFGLRFYSNQKRENPGSERPGKDAGSIGRSSHLVKVKLQQVPQPGQEDSELLKSKNLSKKHQLTYGGVSLSPFPSFVLGKSYESREPKNSFDISKNSIQKQNESREVSIDTVPDYEKALREHSPFMNYYHFKVSQESRKQSPDFLTSEKWNDTGSRRIKK